VVGAVLLSCRKDFDSISTSQWQPELAAPFIHSDLTIRNIIGSDSNLYTTPDSLLVYIHLKDSVFKLTADSVLQITDEITYEHKYTLGAIKVDAELFNEPFKLEEMLSYIDEDIADSLRKYDGTMQYFPPFQMLEPARQTFKPSVDYEYLEFSKGALVVSVTNTMPVPFEDIAVYIEDIDFGQLSKSFNIPSLQPDETFVDSISLNNIMVGNEFAIDITSFYTAGSFPEKVLIDLQEGFNFNLVLKEGEVISGKGKIDEQILESDTSMIQYEPEHGEKLFHLTFREGRLNYQVSSGLPMTAVVDVRFPTALIDGEVPEDSFVLESAEEVNETASVNGLSIDFTSVEEQPYNQFPVEFTIALPPTDYMVTFDSSDYVTAIYVFDKIKLAYADGYFGKREINVSRDTISYDVEFLDQLKGEIILTEPVVEVDYINEIGVPFRFLPVFLGINTSTGEIQDLNSDSVTVNAPEQAGDVAYGKIRYDNSNSSIVDFIAIRPDMIVYDGAGYTNWNEVDFNFVYDTSLFTGNSTTTLPLILKSNFFAFTDTAKISMDDSDNNLKEGLMIANLLNGFPFEMHLQLRVPDSVTGEILETVDFGMVESAIVGSDGVVIEPTPGQLTGAFDEDFMDNLTRASYALVYVESETFNNGSEPVELHSDYKLNLAIGFQLKVQP
jgi:hypothetical protein